MFWSKAHKVSALALAQGDLLPLSTEPQLLIEAGIEFHIHLKNNNSTVKFSPKPPDFNPFLPYDEAMFVDYAGEHHVCLLNKFPVLSPHLLICSNQFIEQTSPLTLEDFSAWLLGFKNGQQVLGFYNGGKTAGASQRHRHMQLVNTTIPLAKVISEGLLPFEHRLFTYTQLDPQTLLSDYQQGLTSLNLYQQHQCRPYNILLTEKWMLIVPRKSNNVNGIFANGINYSGHFLLANETQIQWLTDYGILNFLADCAQDKTGQVHQ